VTKPFTVWFTGVPGSGKTTLAKMLNGNLRTRGIPCAVLDGGDIRKRTGDVLGFTAAARKVHVVYCAVAAAVLNEAGVCAAAALVSPMKEARAQARGIIGDRFFEVYLTCTSDMAKARAGDPGWVGIHVPYEESDDPDLKIDTTLDEPDQSFASVLSMLHERGTL
jgi:adenylylsulfate kinase-like enzyme